MSCPCGRRRWRRRWPLRLGLGLGLVAATAGGCGTAPQPTPGSAQVRITARDLRFEPTSVEVPANSPVTVTLVNAAGVEHSFTADPVHASADADPGEENTVTFTSPASGTIPFHCRWHPRMTGTLVVSPSLPTPTPVPGG